MPSWLRPDESVRETIMLRLSADDVRKGGNGTGQYRHLARCECAEVACVHMVSALMFLLAEQDKKIAVLQDRLSKPVAVEDGGDYARYGRCMNCLEKVRIMHDGMAAPHGAPGSREGFLTMCHGSFNPVR